MSIKVSVIIPAYNTEKYIAQAISSALAQTLKDIEVIVVDDCSTDNTVEIVRGFSDPRVKLLLNPKNLGAGGARNKAIQAAKGKWIAVLDSDDWYAPQRLEVLVKIAEHKNADLVADDSYLIEDGASTPWSTVINESGVEVSSIQQFEAADFILTDIEGKPGLRLGFTKPIFRREFLVENQIKYENIRVTQDFWFDISCFMHGAKFFLLPEAYYFYRARQGSLVSSNKIQRMEEECEVITRFLKNTDYLNHNEPVAKAMQLKLQETRKWLNYYSVVEPLKQGKILVCLQRILVNPGVLQHLISNIPSLIVQRCKNYLTIDNQASYQKSMFKT
ncbi:glycosyltransferase family 2 protein [Pleurocapsales cyanobacterium LEGE 10410]|nr:glycosyltransferase family 2 protein [Pleurocapsales cyanobacterium LEGE 10410]